MNRKDEHISLAKAFHQPKQNDFDAVRLIHDPLPETAVANVDIGTELLGSRHSSPFFINAMTGGSPKAQEINQQLAEIAKACDLMMATGSVSAALKDESLTESFTIVRKTHPTGFLMANVGANVSVEQALKAVELFQADALQLHLNAPQELVMPEGDRDFTGILRNIEMIIQHVDVPVVVKEVGFGMTRETILQLLTAGVETVDISGRGGTSFTQIENARRSKREMDYLAEFGQSTVVSLIEAAQVPRSIDTIASGGIRNAFDIFKALILGADSVGISGTILNQLLTNGQEATLVLIQGWQEELRLLYTMVGRTNTKALESVPVVFTDDVLQWCLARNIDIRKYANK